MKPALFVDTYIIINVLINWVCLYTASKLIVICTKQYRLILASLFGAAYAVISLFTVLSGAGAFLALIAASALMCRIAFGKTKPLRFICSLGVTLVCGFACGGFAEGIVNLSGSFGTDKKIGLSVLIITSIFLVTAFKYSGELAKQRLSTVRATVKIEAFGKTKRMIGLCDSGNLLTEPISGWPVLIIGALEARGFVPGEYFGLSSVPDENFFVVPLSTLSGKKLIYGFVPRELVISGAGRKKPKSISEVIVAVDAQTDLFGGCGCLVPAKLI